MNERPAGPESTDSPFQKAQLQRKRIKILAFGETGSGKTWFTLGFPRAVLIDTEGGADLYADKFEFDVLRTASFDGAMEAVRWLSEHPHPYPYRTVVVDPITILWDSLQRKWSDIFLKRNKQSKGYKFEYFDFQPRDWMTIKAEWKEFVRRLISVDATVIVTARERILYSDSGFMQPAGFTFDAEKSLAYFFDIVLRFHRDAKGRFLATVVKDRSGKLPTGDFEPSYALFARFFGAETFTREAKPVVPASDEMVREVRALAITLGLRDEVVQRRLAAHGVDRIEDLPADGATAIITKWKAALAAKTDTTPTQKET